MQPEPSQAASRIIGDRRHIIVFRWILNSLFS